MCVCVCVLLPYSAHTQGYHACISVVEPTAPPFAGIKSNNYLRNVLAQMDAEDRGFDVVSVLNTSSISSTSHFLLLAVPTCQTRHPGIPIADDHDFDIVRACVRACVCVCVCFCRTTVGDLC